MDIVKFDLVGFSWQDMLAAAMNKGRRKKVSDDMSAAAQRAYEEGALVLEMQSVLEIYEKKSCWEYVELSLPVCGTERIYIGLKAGYLDPAEEIAVLLCTVGKPLTALIHEYAKSEDYLMMYYLDVFGVQALGEISSKMRSRVESLALERGWGVGPSMQPGAIEGWGVEGQRDLYRLGHGEKIGLTLNDASFLIPHISNSAIIGMGPHYSDSKVGSMCHECPRKNTCLWRRENVSE
ncbi:hypothetical protein [Cloacibacillus evryensis]|uniref:hypothetical protein n=1 Tax=Cloacibacillus evryensis TaxID=508460 RepID=UPI00370D52D1